MIAKLRMMVCQKYLIAEPLKPYVKVIWSMESEECWAPPMRILPDSCVELVIHFNQPYKPHSATTHTQYNHKASLSLNGKTSSRLNRREIGMISIPFSAYGAYPSFGMPMKEISKG